MCRPNAGIRWLTGKQDDHAQLHNLLASSPSELRRKRALKYRSVDALVDRLDALMMVQKSCKEQACYDPWRSLHPGGEVRSLADALSPEYDEFYAGQTKVRYNYCSRGFLLDAEGPQEYDVYGDDEQTVQRLMRFDRDWSLRV